MSPRHYGHPRGPSPPGCCPGAATRSARIAELCGLDPTDTVVGLVYLGWPNSAPECPPRPEPDLAWIDIEAPELS